jgi:trimethylamine:corrinoid methyltransferase-like protein
VVVKALLRAILMSLELRKLAKLARVCAVEKPDLVQRVLFAVAPVKLKEMNDQVIRAQTAISIALLVSAYIFCGDSAAVVLVNACLTYKLVKLA